MNFGRLIIDPPRCGAMNMALDETILDRAATAGEVTLRFYQWSEPTLSLGYFQSYAERYLHVGSRNCPLVRRSSGGGAILHHRELTYACALPVRGPMATAKAELFQHFHTALVDVLLGYDVTAELVTHPPAPVRGKNPAFLCFQRTGVGDVILHGNKVAGSAQRSRQSALLQHGSLLLQTSSHAPELPGVVDVSGQRLEPGELAKRWTEHLNQRLGFTLAEQPFCQAELAEASWLAARKFGGVRWTYRR